MKHIYSHLNCQKTINKTNIMIFQTIKLKHVIMHMIYNINIRRLITIRRF